nr:GNAT family N-acetyltransferase [uncultured Flavobacterium sp.]
MLNTKRTFAENKDFQKLVVLLDQDLAIRDGDNHAFYAQFDKLDKIKNVVVCHQDDVAIGCGAFKEFDSNTVEIKRMFVHPDFRGKGIANTVLTALELWAKRIQLYQLRS